MRCYKTPAGETRLWYDDGEIERLVEDELDRSGIGPSSDAPVTDLEAFVERHLGCSLDQYREIPFDVLGFTEFRQGQPPTICLNRDLTGSALDTDHSLPGRIGRWRATLAHEAGHVLLHQSLFEVDERQQELFETDPISTELLRCLKVDASFQRVAHDWREVQANKAMAALLMPQRLFRALAGSVADAMGMRTPVAEGSPAATVLARRMSEICAVSRQAATIRLRTLRLATPANTATL